MDKPGRSDWHSLAQFEILAKQPDMLEQLYLNEVLHRNLCNRIVHDGEDITPRTLSYFDEELEELLNSPKDESDAKTKITAETEDVDEPEPEIESKPEVAGSSSGSDRSSRSKEMESEEDTSHEGSSLLSEETETDSQSSGETHERKHGIEMPLSNEVMQKFLDQFPPLPPEGDPLPEPLVRRYDSDKPNLDILDEKPPEPQKITILLQETETFFLFELPSVTGLKGTEEGDQIEKDNEQYEGLVAGEGRYRNRKSIGVQSTWIMWRENATQAPRIQTNDVGVLATRYDLYKSFQSDGATPKKK